MASTLLAPPGLACNDGNDMPSPVSKRKLDFGISPGSRDDAYLIEALVPDNQRSITSFCTLLPTEMKDRPSVGAAIEAISADVWSGGGMGIYPASGALLGDPDLSDASAIFASVTDYQASLTTSEVADSLALMEPAANWGPRGAFSFNPELPLTAYAIGAVHGPPMSTVHSISNSRWLSLTSMTGPAILSLLAVGVASFALARRR
jgi:hypothetical protein